MVEIARDEIPLDDERKIRAIIKRLGLPQLDPSAYRTVADDLSPERPVAFRPSKPLAHWERYLQDGKTALIWHNKTDIWLTVNVDAGVLYRLVISGLSAEKDAKVLRSEAWRLRAASDEPLSLDAIERMANEVVSKRAERDYQDTFLHCLKQVRHFFEWENGRVVEGGGWLLPISKMSLRAEDIELLRQVYAALPRTIFHPTGEERPAIPIEDDLCPLCGGEGTNKEIDQETPLKDRKAARKQIADRGFAAWLNARLTDEDKPGIWTRPRVLYDDYVSWIGSKREEQTRGDFAEERAATMSSTAWGRAMGERYTRRRDGKNNLYNVRLKKR